MQEVNYMGFLVLSIVFHATYLFSIFDMYFVDTLVRSSQNFRVQDQFGIVAPAKRLFLFVGDGVRADKALEGFPRSNNDDQLWYAAPFLRSRILSHGTFGISHTRIPSKTRPGHIAITAGVYEDISGLAAEWIPLREEIDTVFTRSHRSWMWGSPDVVSILKGNTFNQMIYTDTYSEALEDFAINATQLDTWVFDRVKAMFQYAESSRSLQLELKEDRSIFFLHLLGPDTTGHAYRPSSQEYLDNIKHVDDGVREISKLVEDFFGDNQTAFVFTSDHGMSDWGSHGDGNPDNTRTPLVAWGAGVAKPQLTRNLKTLRKKDILSSGWGLDHIQSHDVQQADVAALITYLLGSEFPVSSVGYIPLPYLDAGLRVKALAAMSNARAVLDIYRVKEAKEKARRIWFSPYKMFRRGDYHPEQQIDSVEDLVSAGQYEQAIWESKDLYSRTRKSLEYLQTYDSLFLGIIITSGYLSWIIYVFTRVIDAHRLQIHIPTSRSRIWMVILICFLIGLFSISRYECSPWRYYLYPIFPTIFIGQLISRQTLLADGMKILTQSRSRSSIYKSSSLQAGILIFILETSVRFYFNRSVVTYSFWVASFYPISYGWSFMHQNYISTLAWVFCCYQMSIFTILPALKNENPFTIGLGGVIISVIGISYQRYDSVIASSFGFTSSPKANQLSLNFQVIMVVFALLVARSSALSLQNKQGLPFVNQMSAWVLLVTSLIFPLVHQRHRDITALRRLMMKFLATAPTYVLLTISDESLFYICLYATLLSWLKLQSLLRQHERSRLSHCEQKLIFRSPKIARAICAETQCHLTVNFQSFNVIFLCLLLHAAIFSAGNTSSLASFSLKSACRFVTAFSPTVQGGLLLFKFLIPLIMILETVHVLSASLKVPSGLLFTMATFLLDFIILRFFLTLRSTGDWLKVGAGISHFLIANILVIGVSFVELAGFVLRSI